MEDEVKFFSISLKRKEEGRGNEKKKNERIEGQKRKRIERNIKINSKISIETKILNYQIIENFRLWRKIRSEKFVEDIAVTELLSSVKYNIKDPELYCVVLWLWSSAVSEMVLSLFSLFSLKKIQVRNLSFEEREKKERKINIDKI